MEFLWKDGLFVCIYQMQIEWKKKNMEQMRYDESKRDNTRQENEIR